jgi:hypothetical protein
VTEDFAGAMAYASIPRGKERSPAHESLLEEAPDTKVKPEEFQIWMRCFLLGMQEVYQPLDPNAKAEARSEEFPSCRLGFCRDITVRDEEGNLQTTTVDCRYREKQNAISITGGYIDTNMAISGKIADRKVPGRAFSAYENAFLSGFEETLHAVYCNRPENQERYAAGREAGWRPGMDLEMYDNDPREQDIVRPMQALVERMQLGTPAGITSSIDMVPFRKSEQPGINPQPSDQTQGVDLSRLGITGGGHHNEGELNHFAPPSAIASGEQRSQDVSPKAANNPAKTSRSVR